MSIYRAYIPDSWHESIINYKYVGCDNSILYRYYMSPMCNYLVEYFPKWVAPNVITICGLGLVVLMDILINSFSGLDGQGDIPAYISIISALLYYTYHILDNIDGKQARRTNNSSPLGMLVDHGCDSITTFLLSVALCSIMKFKDGIWFGILWSLIGTPFFICTWEQCITGKY
jgi:ethanolaminephosphotransferase